MLLANIFGQLTILTAEMNKSTIKFQEKLDTINTAMSNLGLPKWLKIEIKEYYINTSNRQDQQSELNHFLENISPSFRLKISYEIFHHSIHKNIVFNSLFHSNDSTIMQFIIKRLEIELATPEYVFMVQDEEVKLNLTENSERDKRNDYMFFIAKGECNVMVKDKLYEGHEELLVRTLQPGEHFGEISLLYGCNRTATVSANNYCTLAKLSKSHLDELTHKYPKLI